MWIAAPRREPGDLTGTFWRFGALEGPEFSSFLVLSAGGRIGNYRHPNEDMWQVLDGRLAFYTRDGAIGTLFDKAILRDGAVEMLAGEVRLPGLDVVHYLLRTSHPPFADVRSPVDRRASFMIRLVKPERPNLVVLRAGPSSLHPDWSRNIVDRDRNWDLCVSYYGNEMGALDERPEYLTHQPGQRKFEALHDLFDHESPLWHYDRVWFPDDDLATSWGDINRLFHISRRERLELAQPALQPTPDCHINHQITVQRPNMILRHTSFVEIMCPVFSRDALRVCLGSFRDSRTGFGLDHLWPALLGWPRFGVAIIDDVALVHTRPLGHTYDLTAATLEEGALRKAYGLGHHDWTTIDVPRI